MKIVTFNLRYENPWDGVYRFENRFPYIVNRIQRELPDLIGFQEMLPEMAEKLKEALPEYYILGHGREADLTGEQTAVGFLKNRFHLFRMRTFWLSETPDVPGSRYEGQSPCPRTCTCLTLYSLMEKQLFRIYNTHLDHSGSYARKIGLDQIIREMKKDNAEKPLPALLMGDFNTTPENPELNSLREWPWLTDRTKNAEGTFHNFGREKPPVKIDYIFATGQWKQKHEETVLWKEQHNGLWLSDHYPVSVEMYLEKSNNSDFFTVMKK